VRIGLVCPYSLDVPGGAQNHVRDLAEALLARGHDVSVLAPAEPDADLPGYVVAAGRAVPVPYNGSVSRVAFGPVTAARVRRWLAAGRFEVVHVHEPATPSVSLLTLWACTDPMVGTFHTSNPRSRMMSAASAILLPALEKLAARIAVSEDARATLVQHLGGEPVIIPNGVYVSRYADARPDPALTGSGRSVVFLGRMDESRKGLPIFLRAVPAVLRAHADVIAVVAGKGDAADAAELVPLDLRHRVHFAGMIDDRQKLQLLAGADVYVAPNTGGESFGIVLIEAMAAGAAVVASDIGAFRRVLADGANGQLFRTGDPEALATTVNDLLADDARRAALARVGQEASRAYDWSILVERVLAVYALVLDDERPARVVLS